MSFESPDPPSNSEESPGSVAATRVSDTRPLQVDSRKVGTFLALAFGNLLDERGLFKSQSAGELLLPIRSGIDANWLSI